MTRVQTPQASSPDKGTNPGWVSFVGSGPGDPGLLTVRAVELLESAEVIVTEAPEHVDLVRSVLGLVEGRDGTWDGPEVVDGGFGEDGQPLTHAARAKVVVRHGKKQRVVRLMTGDPFLYASGPEEAQACVKAGVGFEVVPGVSSVSAVPAYAGIPLTHRGLSSSVAIITGHEDPSKGETSVRWEHLARAVETLVILIGTENLPAIVERLLQAGRSPDTPAAAIQWGTLPHQRVISAPLARLPAVAREAGLGAPAVIVIGPVADHDGYVRRLEEGTQRVQQIADHRAAGNRGQDLRQS